MTPEVQRLQSLLQTVQRNRQKSRPDRPQVTAASVAAGAVAEEAEEQVISLVPDAIESIAPEPEPLSPAMPQPEARTAPMPRLDPPVSAPSPGPSMPSRPSRPSGGAPPAAKRKGPASPLMAALDDTLGKTVPPAPLASTSGGSAAPAGPQQVPLSPVAEGSKPVAQMVSAVPAIDELTFGELLHRSLSLRPR